MPKKNLTPEQECEAIYTKSGFSSVLVHVYEQQVKGNPAYKDVVDEFCQPCDNVTPSLNHTCLVCGSPIEQFTIRQEIERLYPDSKMLFADGFDEAILGVDINLWSDKSDEGDDSKERVVYSIRKIMQILVDDGMEYEDARDHFEFNIIGGYVGVHTPVFVEDEDLSAFDKPEAVSDKLIPNSVVDDVAGAWNELEELDADFNELSDDDLKSLKATLHSRIKRAMSLIAKYVPDKQE